MATLRVRALAAIGLCFAVGCHFIGGLDGYVEGSKYEDDGGVGASGAAPGVGGSTTSANGGASTGTPPGTGGAPPMCDDIDCEMQATSECETCACIDGLVCSCMPITPGTPCTATAGVCFDGGCVPCLENSDCSGSEDVCEDKTCVGPSCSDGTLNGSETAIDCGGSCAPCAVGSACMGSTDCTTKLCVNQVCTNCTGDGDCGVGRYCYENVCHNKRPNGQDCEDNLSYHPNWCLSGNCCFGSCTQFCAGICSCE